MFALKMYFFVFLNLIDLIYILTYYEFIGEKIEANPIAKIIIANFGLIGIIALKSVAVTFFIMVITLYHKKYRKKAMNVINFSIYVYLVPFIIIVCNIF